MDSRIYEKTKDVIESVELAKNEPDQISFLNNTLQSISQCLNAPQSMAIIQGEGSHQPEFVLRNMREEFLPKYQEYYYRIDPFKFLSNPKNKSRLILGPGHDKGVVCLEELVDYRDFVGSEYFCDFLVPQRQYHKVMCYLKSRSRLIGMIGLFRPRRMNRFSNANIQVLQLVTPLISTCMENIEIRSKTQVKSGLFDIYEKEASIGMMLVNHFGNLLYLNDKAKEICHELSSTLPQTEKVGISLPKILMDDFQSMVEALNYQPNTMLIPPQQRTVKSQSNKYSYCCQFVDIELDSVHSNALMITFRQVGSFFDLNKGRLHSNYGLTNREIEIVSYIMEGFRNIGIADKLFISELTVKKHIQNIFEKMRVSNRTTLVREILMLLADEGNTGTSINI